MCEVTLGVIPVSLRRFAYPKQYRGPNTFAQVITGLSRLLRAIPLRAALFLKYGNADLVWKSLLLYSSRLYIIDETPTRPYSIDLLRGPPWP